MSKTQATRLTHSNRIVAALEDEIVSGRCPPGSHLNEQKIADRFKVSRTPVREAVRYLASTGLVEMRPRRGAFVSEVPTVRLLQMFEAMTELEGSCARLAARRMRPQEKEHLSAIHNSYAELACAEHADAYYDASLEFHRLIFLGTHNEFLAEYAVRLFNQLAGYRRGQLRSGERAQHSFREHTAVLEAIIEGDGDLAAERMRQHTEIVGDKAMDIFELLGEGSEGLRLRTRRARP